MDLASVNSDIIGRTFPAILPSWMLTDRSRLMLLAIGLQESRFVDRDQRESPGGKDLVDGPAMSFWQMERGGGVKGVMTHQASAAIARKVCAQRGVPFTTQAVWKALESDDLLACAFARLLLLTDPKPLPAIDDAEGAWEYYVRNWRPGAVKRDYKGLHEKFLRNHAKARAEI